MRCEVDAENVGRYPLDVVKTRIQLQHGKVVGTEGYTGVLDCFRKIVKQEGFTRLYRGITAPILMEVPKRLVSSLMLRLGCLLTDRQRHQVLSERLLHALLPTPLLRADTYSAIGNPNRG
jgi:hypothetical protein